MRANFGMRLAPLVGLLALGSSAVIACGDDDDADTAEPTTSATETTAPADDNDTAIEAAVRDAFEAYNAQDADGFFGVMTDDGARGFLESMGMPVDDLEAAKAEAAAFLGDPPIEVQELSITESSDEAATVEAISESGAVLEGDRLELVKDREDWKIDGLVLFAVSPEIPDGYETVELGLAEFAFEMADEPVPAGQVAFDLDNTGARPHEAFLVKVAEGVDIMEAVQSEGEPEGVEFIGGVFNVAPGDSYNLVFTPELEAGGYAFVCFLPDTDEGPEGTPHAFKGMVREFTVE